MLTFVLCSATSYGSSLTADLSVAGFDEGYEVTGASGIKMVISTLNIALSNTHTPRILFDVTDNSHAPPILYSFIIYTHTIPLGITSTTASMSKTKTKYLSCLFY